jgi:hypothetical protein
VTKTKHYRLKKRMKEKGKVALTSNIGEHLLEEVKLQPNS